MKKHVIIFEVRGGSDKGPYGFRRDSKPIIDSLKKRGWTAEIIFYQDTSNPVNYNYKDIMTNCIQRYDISYAADVTTT